MATGDGRGRSPTASQWFRLGDVRRGRVELLRTSSLSTLGAGNFAYPSRALTSAFQRYFFGADQIDGALGTVTEWTPADLTVLPNVWLDASDSGNISLTGSAVNSWTSKGAHAVTLVNRTASSKPTYIADGFNGRPVISGDGVDDCILADPTGATNAQWNGSDSKSANVFMAAKYVRGTVWLKWENFPNRWGVESNNIWDYPTFSDRLDTLTYPRQKPSIFYFEPGGGTKRAYYNDRVDASSEAFASSSGSVTGYISMFASSDGSFAGQVDIAEVVHLNYNPTADEVDRITGYLAHKYGLEGDLPSDHPYRYVPPLKVVPPTEAADTLSATGTVGAVGITGTLAVTEAADTLSATGNQTTFGALAVTEAADTLSAAGTQRTFGALAVTEAADTLSAAGTQRTFGALGVTEAADTLSATGQITTTGTLAVTEAADTLAATGATTGQLAVTEAADTLSASGQITTFGATAVTEAADTLSAAGNQTTFGALAVTEAADTLSASGSVGFTGITGDLAVTEAADTLSASGQITTFGALAATEAADTLAATGTQRTFGALAVTEAADTLAATGNQRTFGALAVTEAADTLSASGTITDAILGSLNVTEAPDTLAATGDVTGTGFVTPSGGGNGGTSAASRKARKRKGKRPRYEHEIEAEEAEKERVRNTPEIRPPSEIEKTPLETRPEIELGVTSDPGELLDAIGRVTLPELPQPAAGIPVDVDTANKGPRLLREDNERIARAASAMLKRIAENRVRREHEELLADDEEAMLLLL